METTYQQKSIVKGICSTSIFFANNSSKFSVDNLDVLLIF